MKHLQNWSNIRQYSSDYLDLVYNVYAESGISYISTYYNFDFPNSNIDKTMLDAGAYQLTGDLSGNLWRKILLLPLYNVEQIQNPFMSDERGFGKFDTTSSCVIPSIYNLQSTPLDFISFEEVVLNSDRKEMKVKPAYRVQTFEKATNTNKTFWKLNLKISDRTTFDLDQHLSGNYTFVDYEKAIYPTDRALALFQLMKFSREIPLNNFFNQRCGFYFQNKI